jgi:hypothetical protein
VKAFLKWTALTTAATAGVLLGYSWMCALRDRLDSGLERVERIAGEAEQALAHTERTLGETAKTAHAVRQSLG